MWLPPRLQDCHGPGSRTSCKPNRGCCQQHRSQYDQRQLDHAARRVSLLVMVGASYCVVIEGVNEAQKRSNRKQ